MKQMRPTRRALLALAGLAGGAGLSGMAQAQSQAQACFDRSKLAAGDLSLRRSLGFQDISADPKRACGGCAFFTAAQPASCGKCMLLSGGPVSAGSVCGSWAARR